MKTALTPTESNELTERIARWAVSLKIGSFVAFLLEINRPIAPLSGNMFIATDTFATGLSPVSFHAIGLLLQDATAVDRLRERILQLEEESPVEIGGK